MELSRNALGFTKSSAIETARGLSHASLGVPLLLLIVLAMMTLPVPAFLLDILFTFNIAMALVVLLVSVYAQRPLNFALFPTPMLVAKGVDNVAAYIREVAEANKVTIVAYPILARSLFYTTELNQFIPQGLYVAVAQILAYVFQLKQYRKGQGTAPRPLGNLDIPDEFVQMANRT